MLRGRLDRTLISRLLLPLFPVAVLVFSKGLSVLTPTALVPMTMVLSARSLADGSFDGIPQIAFGFVPLLLGTVLYASTTDGSWGWAVILYILAATGTILAAIEELDERH